jgi:hypothetical protein
MVRSALVFLLINCLVLAAVPIPSQSKTNPKAPDAKEKTTLTALTNSDLLRQKAGDIIRAAQKLDPDTKDFFKKLEAQNPWLLDQKAGDESIAPPSWPVNKTDASSQKSEVKKGDGISTVGAVGIVCGAILLLGGLVLLASGYQGGGSC